MNIPITKPFFDDQERKALLEPLDSGWVVQGPKVKAFEEAVKKFAAAKVACATTSCTTALHMAVIACGIGEGDEVLVPAFTFIASANVVEYVKAKPVFVDIDLATYNIDVQQLAAAITPRTKAIMPVHLFGLCADMNPILDLAAKHRLRVIEDAACAIGGFYQGKHAGTMGDVGCLSFHPRKSITTGEGGMVLSNNPEIGRKIEILRDHGAEMTDLARHEGQTLLLPDYRTLGFNYRMTDFQGALGYTQMQKLPLILDRKRMLADRYREKLANLNWLRLPSVPADCLHGYQAFVCLFAADSIANVTETSLEALYNKRNDFMNRLAKLGVSTRQGTHSVHALTYYENKYNLRPWSFPKSWIAEKLTLALPLYPSMTEEEVDFVCDSVKRCHE
jgi:dTDP-4-amino-4,6-dideoxygalactose transaminase